MNPIVYARHLSAISGSGLAKQLGVSRQYISRLEQGLYDRPNKDLLNWSVEIINKTLEEGHYVTVEGIEKLYREWQWTKRRSVKLDKALRPCSLTDFDIAKKEVIYFHKLFSQWRNDYWPTPHAFAIDMCVSPSKVVEYEDGLTVKMPSVLKDVLTRLNLLGKGFNTHER